MDRVMKVSNVVSFKEFVKFVWADKVIRYASLICMFLSLIQFFLFKYYYPYPSFINGDSYVYINSAFSNLSIDTYPIGYPKFLRLFSVFSTSDTVLVFFQFFFLQLNICFLILSAYFLFKTVRYLWLILLVVLICINPLTIYLSNYISSDSLFVSLSVFWFTLLIWIVYRPTLGLVVFHSFIALIAFMVRYNALYYPVISILVLFLYGGRRKTIMGGVLSMLVFIGVFIIFTLFQYKKTVGEFIFSPFSGWQMANNGMYAYKFVDSSSRKRLPDKFNEIDQDVRQYFDTRKSFFWSYPNVMLDVSTEYMWDPSSPLRVYMEKKFEHSPQITEFKRWSTVSTLYKDYGLELIKNYPDVYVKKFVWPNLVRYYVPPVEFLETYGFAVDTIPLNVQRWFGYKGKKVITKFKDNRVYILDLYPTICAMMNAVYIVLGISFLLLGGRKKDQILFKAWLLSVLLWGCNFSFSVFASPIALRFQVFPLFVCVVFNFIILDYMLKEMKEKRV